MKDMIADAVHMLDRQIVALLALCPDTHATTKAAYHFGKAIGILKQYVGEPQLPEDASAHCRSRSAHSDRSDPERSPPDARP
jgi:hypothetical protein